jgi:hypothetical protein
VLNFQSTKETQVPKNAMFPTYHPPTTEACMPADMKPTLSNPRRLAEDHAMVRPLALRVMNEPNGPIVTGHGTVPPAASHSQLNVSVSAAIVAMSRDEPMVLATTVDGIDSLPSANFQAGRQPTLDACLRDGVAEQTGLRLGYMEQLVARADGSSSDLGIGYLALTRTTSGVSAGAVWRSWYDYLPWEDWREGRPPLLSSLIEPRLRVWAEAAPAVPDASRGLTPIERIRMAFGLDRTPWNEERVTDRFDLLCETGLMDSVEMRSRGMRIEHARMLASAIGRLRAKLKIRPVIFELMDGEFTLFELQKTVEAILGPHLHKQNFRRLIESAGLVEPTGEVRSKTGGRPAKLFRFRHEVLMERPAPGVRVHAQHM